MRRLFGRSVLPAAVAAAAGYWVGAGGRLAPPTPAADAAARPAVIEPRPATEATQEANRRAAERLPSADPGDFEDARRGLIAPLPDGGVVRDAQGTVVWDPTGFAFLAEGSSPPDTVHPGLWDHARLVAASGLFEVVPRIYQVRGYDLANVTFIEGDSGVIVVDPLFSEATARAALDLYYRHRPKRAVVAVLFTHNHIDHFGGARGVVSEEDVRTGRVRVIAPGGSLNEALAENVLIGNVTRRRSSYMYGDLLPPGPRGAVGAGLGLGLSAGPAAPVRATETIASPRGSLVIDGLRFECLSAPDTEAPAETHFYIPELKALCTAENAVHSLHNIGTLRGAKPRDARAWSACLDETSRIWGPEAEVLFAPHHWPTLGNAEVVRHLSTQRDLYKYVHDQTLRLANRGLERDLVAELVTLPPELAEHLASHGYYGNLSQDVKGVYDFYLGWFAGDPASINPHPGPEASRRYVAFMGGPDAVLAKARESFAAGDYRWVAEVVGHVVRAERANVDARSLLAEALEQLGYQAESAAWRNYYLTGAQELRNGVDRSRTARRVEADILRQVPVEFLLDAVAIRVDGRRAAGKRLVINIEFADQEKAFTLTLRNSVLRHAAGKAEGADCTVRLNRAAFDELLLRPAGVVEKLVRGEVVVRGDASKLVELLLLLDSFDPWFEVATPVPAPPADGP